MSEVYIPTKSAFPESVNTVNLIEARGATRSSSDADDAIIPVIVPPSKAALAPSETLELVVLIQELHSSNSNLLKRVIHLEQALAECQKDLQSHKKRTHVAESISAQQSQDLAATQEQVKCLSHELSASHQTGQRQQILIENLTDQLESSQERVAQIERECSLIQASYNEQSHALMQSEDTCGELRTRLTRQQRYTLQLKVALEKCLEIPFPSYQPQADTDNTPTRAQRGQTKPSIQSQSSFAKQQPIPAWSAQPESLSNEISLFNPMPPTTWSESAEDLSTLVEEEENHLSSEKTSEAEEADWQDLLNLLQAVEEPATANLLEAAIAPSAPPGNAPTQLDGSLNESNFDSASLLNTSSEPLLPEDRTTQRSARQFDASFLNGGNRGTELAPQRGEQRHATGSAGGSGSELTQAQFQFTESPQQEMSSFTPNSNWPSPVVYPLRPPKGRKSLAAIELPSFNQRGSRQ